MQDDRRHAPATARNRDPILAVLRDELPASGTVLEVASGTGEHAAWFAAALPGLTWQPTDGDAASLASIRSWTEDLPNVRPPVVLDAASDDWPVDGVDAVFCANMIHISPWASGLGLLAGAARRLPPGAPLVLYGPYQTGADTAPSNLAFDASLRARDPSWGVRDLDAVLAAAAAVGLDHTRTVTMPANNLILVLRRTAPR